MSTNVNGFINACRYYLSTLSIGDLRAYGRNIGVARPTAKNKEVLIEDIIGILTGELLPIPISKQGAPVKNCRVDERIPAKIETLKEDYAMAEEESKPFDFTKMRMETLKKAPDFTAAKVMDMDIPSEVEGQIEVAGGTNWVIPLDANEEDRIYLPQVLMEKKNLREGDVVFCRTGVKKNVPQITKVVTINDLWEDAPKERPHFDECAAASFTKRIRIYDVKKYNAIASKFMEWLFPLARGQRGCVISSPKAGKTRLLLQLARSAKNLNAEMEVYVLLVDQSPEEVAEFQRVVGKNNILYTTYEDSVEKQVFNAEFILKRVKRRAECGKDVLLLIDSLTALAHAYNDTEESGGGKTLSCGLEIKTIRYMKRYFGVAKALETGGSLTMVGAVAMQTGNPFDDIVCAELSSQANYEIRLDNQLAMRRVYPAMNLTGTNVKQTEGLRHEKEEELDFILRNDVLPKIGAEGLLNILADSESYQAFLEEIEKILQKE